MEPETGASPRCNSTRRGAQIILGPIIPTPHHAPLWTNHCDSNCLTLNFRFSVLPSTMFLCPLPCRLSPSSWQRLFSAAWRQQGPSTFSSSPCSIPASPLGARRPSQPVCAFLPAPRLRLCTVTMPFPHQANGDRIRSVLTEAPLNVQTGHSI